MKASVSALALAFCLAACTSAFGRHVRRHRVRRAGRRAGERRSRAAPTLEEAHAFVAEAEKELSEFAVINSRAQWVNATYITDDTDALAAHFGTIGTEMSVRFANEAAAMPSVPGPRLRHQAQARHIARRAGASGADHRRRRRRAQHHLDPPQLDLRQGPRNARRQADDRQRPRGEDGHGPQPGPAAGDVDELARPMSAGRCAPDYARLTEIANQGAKELGYPDTGAMWRSRYDMPPDEFAAMTDRLWNEVKPLYDELHCYTRAKLNEKYGDAVQPETGPIRADLLGNMWAQEWGNIYDVVAPKGAGDVGYDLTDLLVRNKYTTREDRQAPARASSPRSASRRCRRPSGPALDDHRAEGPRGDLPRLGLGRRQCRGSAHQDVHQGQCRRLRHRPSRARPQLLPARLQQAASALSRQRQ